MFLKFDTVLKNILKYLHRDVMEIKFAYICLIEVYLLYSIDVWKIAVPYRSHF